jgi:hypothetical protein
MVSLSHLSLPLASRNLGFIIYSNLSFPQRISSVSKLCFYDVRDLTRIRNTTDHTTACTIATSLVHAKVDYCNYPLLNFLLH